MLTKPLVLALLAACGVSTDWASTDPPEQPDEREPPDDDIPENVYFCCHDVDVETKSGNGCITISEKQIDSCASVLVCANGAGKADGKVTCFD